MKQHIKKHNIEQQSEKWFKLRLDYPMTASKAETISKYDYKGGVGLNTLIEEKISEKFSISTKKEHFINEDMKRGIELEPQARDVYEWETGKKVEQVGFVTNTKYELCGVSPDGLVEDGGIEIKCQNDRKHFMSIIKGVQIEEKYKWQMQMQMLICELNWIDFILYNPNFKESMLVERVYPDKTMQEKLKIGLEFGKNYYNLLNEKYKKNNN